MRFKTLPEEISPTPRLVFGTLLANPSTPRYEGYPACCELGWILGFCRIWFLEAPFLQSSCSPLRYMSPFLLMIPRRFHKPPHGCPKFPIVPTYEYSRAETHRLEAPPGRPKRPRSG